MNSGADQPSSLYLHSVAAGIFSCSWFYVVVGTGHRALWMGCQAWYPLSHIISIQCLHFATGSWFNHQTGVDFCASAS